MAVARLLAPLTGIILVPVLTYTIGAAQDHLQQPKLNTQASHSNPRPQANAGTGVSTPEEIGTESSNSSS